MKTRYAVGVQYDNGVRGYFLDDNNKVKMYTSEAEAQKTLRKMLRNTGYSWNCNAKVFAIRSMKELDGENG